MASLPILSPRDRLSAELIENISTMLISVGAASTRRRLCFASAPKPPLLATCVPSTTSTKFRLNARMLRIGVDHGFFQAIPSIDVDQFLKLLLFAKTPKWQQEVQRKALEDRLAHTASKGFTPAEAAWVRLFDAGRSFITPDFEKPLCPEYYGSDERKRRILDYLKDKDSKARLRDDIEEKIREREGTRGAKRLRLLLEMADSLKLVASQATGEVAADEETQDPVLKKPKIESEEATA